MSEIAQREAGDFNQALAREIQTRFSGLLAGIEAYRKHPYRRSLPEPPACWQEGAARLLDYGSSAGAQGVPVLIVPSLVNRAYILDLAERRSLSRWLARQGFRPYLMDWGTPGERELEFGLTDYVAGYLKRALDHLLEAHDGRPPILVGYCMGGLLALVLAQRRQKDLAGLALLATPWDFHAAGSGALTERAALVLDAALPLIAQQGCLPVDALQSLFALQEPMAVAKKFIAFAGLAPESPAARDFVAVEDWVNDGVPLAAPVARECLEDWYLKNLPAAGRWTVAGQEVSPAELGLPCLGVVPSHDRIVPPASAQALCDALPRAEVLRPRSGHIGMIVGQQARQDLWRPLARWMNEQAG